MQSVILDTNFFLIPGEFGVDIIAEFDRICDFSYSLVTFDRVVGELEGLSKEKGKVGVAAKLGLTILKNTNIKVLESASLELDVDGLIVQNARPGEDIVASQDKEVISRVREKGVWTISMRHGRYLQLRRT